MNGKQFRFCDALKLLIAQRSCLTAPGKVSLLSTYNQLLFVAWGRLLGEVSSSMEVCYGCK